MEFRYYLLDATTYKNMYKQRREVKLADIDKDKFIICRESSNIERATSQYGMAEDITKVLYTVVPFALEASTDEILDENKYISDLSEIYEVVDIKKQAGSGEYLYIIGIDKVNE